MRLISGDLTAGFLADEGNGGQSLAPSVSVIEARAAEQITQLDRTTANAKRVLEEAAEALADKTAQLKAARKERDGF